MRFPIIPVLWTFNNRTPILDWGYFKSRFIFHKFIQFMIAYPPYWYPISVLRAIEGDSNQVIMAHILFMNPQGLP